jgi:hypothetical protein
MFNKKINLFNEDNNKIRQIIMKIVYLQGLRCFLENYFADGKVENIKKYFKIYK